MKNAQKSISNTVRAGKADEKAQEIAQTFAVAIKKIDDPRTWEADDPLAEILFTTLVAVCCGSESYYDFATFGGEQLP